MRSNIIKYLFFIAVIIIVIVAIYMIYKNDQTIKQGNQNTNTTNGENSVADLRFEVVGFDNVNPLISKNRNVQEFTKLVFEPLFSLDENYKLTPALAKEWLKSGDNTYMVRLRNDVKWQDGTAFTAQDVKYTVDTLKAINSPYTYNVSHISNTEVMDNYTVKFTVDVAIPFFEYNLIFPIVSSNYFNGQDITNTDKNNTPIATGMYKIEENDSGKITLKKNENWWGKSEKNAKTNTIYVIKYNSMGEAFNAFKLGNIDMLTTDNMDIENNIGKIGYNIKEYYGREHDFLALNTADSMLARTEVRKSISYAIDKSGIVSSVFAGKYYAADNPLNYGNWTFDKNSASIGNNPDQAKQVLIDNGWEYKNGNWQKLEDSKLIKLVVNLTINSDNANYVAVANSIKNNLESIGIHLNIVNLGEKAYRDALNSKNYSMILTGTNFSFSPSFATYFGDGNIANYQNDDTKQALADLIDQKDENKIKEDVTKLINVYKNEAPYVSLYFSKMNFIYTPSLIGNVSPNEYNVFYGIENWYRR